MNNLKARYMHPINGSQGDKDHIAKSGLVLGESYDVSSIDMHGWYTNVHLEGFGGHFNSVNFEFEVDDEPYDIFEDAQYNPYLARKDSQNGA